MSKEPLKTDGVTPYFWDISTKGHLQAAIGEEILKLKIKHTVVPTDRGYCSIFLYCTEPEYRKMRDYISDLENEDMKVVSLTMLKPTDVAMYSQHVQFAQPFKNEIIEYNQRNNDTN